MQQQCQKQGLENRKEKRDRACGSVRFEKCSVFGLMIYDCWLKASLRSDNLIFHFSIFNF